MELIQIPQHTPQEVEAYAKLVGITLEQAKKTNAKREWHILWEHDYIKHPELA